MGYHKAIITKGTIGEISKIQEELDELKDAEDQGVVLMAQIELSDLYGSIEAYLEKHYPTITMDDLKKMSNLTRAAFKSGERR
jgi:hypothetical protein